MKTTQRVLSDPGSVAVFLVAGMIIAVIILSVTPSWGHPSPACHAHDKIVRCP